MVSAICAAFFHIRLRVKATVQSIIHGSRVISAVSTLTFRQTRPKVQKKSNMTPEFISAPLLVRAVLE
jgi:carbohydrate-binding DOMON domain-containing protein